MTEKRAETALEILDRLEGDDPTLQQMVEEERVNAQIARMIYEERSSAQLTQKGLAELVGTSQSVIARLEDSDYEGHSLSMLRRIATALDKRLDVRFLPEGSTSKAA